MTITNTGNVETTTLEGFVELVAVRVGETILQYNAQTTAPSFSEETQASCDAVYERRFTVATEPTRANIINELLNNTTFAAPVSTTLDNKVEEVSVMSLENFGLPTHLVKITDNVYGLFCKDDFKFKQISPTLSAMICYAPKRNFLFQNE